MRIGLRRLRSLLKVFRPVVDSEGLRELDRKARDLGLLLGELRDADVAMDTVGAAAAQRSDDADLASLKGVLANSRAHHREKVEPNSRSAMVLPKAQTCHAARMPRSARWRGEQQGACQTDWQIDRQGARKVVAQDHSGWTTH